MQALCESRIIRVTVHARGALITRTVAVPEGLAGEDLTLIVPDVTVLADAGSMRASVAGARAVVAVRAALHAPRKPVVPGASVELVRALAGRVDRLRAEADRLASHRARLCAIDLRPRFVRAAAGRDETELAAARNSIGARAADALATSSLIGETLERLDARLSEIDEALRDLEHELEAARLADAQAQSRARMGVGHPSRRVSIVLTGSGPVEGVELTYVVPAARWWPTYTLRLGDGGHGATWALEALVAQATGESWDHVILSLSTADLLADARLPELPSRRLGRAQPPVRSGYRPPPAGLEEMFAGYDRAFAPPLEAAAPPPAPPPAPPLPAPAPSVDDVDALAESSVDEEVTFPGADLLESDAQRAPAALALPLPGAFPTPTPPSKEMVVPAAAGPPSTAFGSAGPPVPSGPPVIEPADAWLDFDALAMAGPDDARRGRLVAAAPPRALGVREAQGRIEALSPKPELRDPLTTRGQFDYRYDAAGVVDVPSDALAHRVTLAVASAAPVLSWRTVPRAAAEVYKQAELPNPFPAPLLGGPVDVYLDGSLLATTAIDHIDRGGLLFVGMGVEDRIRVARNARVEEKTAGLMRGATIVETTVTIELASSLGVPAAVEVLDRIPVTDDKGLGIELLPGDHPPERYTQADRGAPLRGGLSWKVEVPAGGEVRIEYRYALSFSAKSEIVGGARRD